MEQRGLSSAEAARLLKVHGPNQVQQRHANALRILWRQMASPLLLLLIVAATGAYFLGQRSDTLIILIMIGVSVLLGFINEYQAARASDALASRTASRARVYRDGQLIEVPASTLVPGDLLDLQLGDIIAADGKVVVAHALECDESALTGESLPVDKKADQDVLAGSIILSGNGQALLTKTGSATQFGTIAAGLQLQRPLTGFQRGLGQFSLFLLGVGIALSTFIFVVSAVLHRPLLEAGLFALAVAVGISPELLPAVVSTGLTRGAHRLAQQKVLVKRLVAVEDLGNVEVLFTDKTGTLTEGQIAVSAWLGADGLPSDSLRELALKCAPVNKLADGSFSGPAVDVALWRAAGAELASYSLLDQRPFDPTHRLAAVLVSGPDENIIVVKGPTDAVLPRCSSVTAELQRALTEAEKSGQRVVVVATATTRANALPAEYGTLQCEGAVLLADPPRESAAQALARLHDLGIRVCIVTGDSGAAAEFVCNRLGLSEGATLLGADIANLADNELAAALETTRICARVTPEQKARIVRVQRAAGADVAFMGDGVNDALAMHAADVGISVDSAVDVARDAADVVLLEKDLAVLAAGVVEGRKSFANTIKYILMGTSSNFGNMTTAAIASSFMPFLPMLPSQILLNNMLYDSSQLAIPADRVDEELIARPAQWDMAMVRRYMARFGLLSTVFDLLTFAILLYVFKAGPAEFRTGWFVESLATQSLVVFVIRTARFPWFKSRPGNALLWSVLAIVAIGCLIPLTPLATDLGFTRLPATFMALIAGLIVVYLLLTDLAKRSVAWRAD